MEWSPLKTTIEENNPLKIAAILAVLQVIQENNSTHSNSGRKTNNNWANDHRRTIAGKSSLLNLKESRSTFR
tara:strand:- start:268 stop:483 length:216 start_codon:yes stop_codon:yes gene_type:complete